MQQLRTMIHVLPMGRCKNCLGPVWDGDKHLRDVNTGRLYHVDCPEHEEAPAATEVN